MDGQMDRYRRLHTDVKTYTSLQPLERATAQIQIQIFIFLEAKKIRLSFLQAWRDKTRAADDRPAGRPAGRLAGHLRNRGKKNSGH